jgi:integrase
MRHVTVLLMTTYYAGMRVGEVATLRYMDIVDVDKTIRYEIILRLEQKKDLSHALCLLARNCVKSLLIM